MIDEDLRNQDLHGVTVSDIIDEVMAHVESENPICEDLLLDVFRDALRDRNVDLVKAEYFIAPFNITPVLEVSAVGDMPPVRLTP